MEIDIVSYRVRKEKIILKNHAEAPAQLLFVKSTYISPVNVDIAFVRIVKSHHKHYDCSFAAAGSPDDTEGFALAD